MLTFTGTIIHIHPGDIYVDVVELLLTYPDARH